MTTGQKEKLQEAQLAGSIFHFTSFTTRAFWVPGIFDPQPNTCKLFSKVHHLPVEKTTLRARGIHVAAEDVGGAAMLAGVRQIGCAY